MLLLNGDCIEEMQKMIDEGIQVDSVVTDPPYELGFMGKSWDSTGIAFQKETWELAYQLLKPGGHLLAFSSSRTYHRMAVRVEDAGFEIRDQIMWIYGSGFPKSHNIGKSVDKLLGNEREVIGTKIHSQKGVKAAEERTTIGAGAFGEPREADITKGTSQYEGWGTALKPAHEPIVMARKPLSEKTVVNNVLEWGTGGINIEESRISYKSKDDMEIRKNTHRETNKLGDGNFGGGKYSQPVESGRFPANIILDKEAGKILDEQSGITTSGKVKETKESYEGESNTGFIRGVSNSSNQHGGTGGASRFFYCPKTSKTDRNEGLEDFKGKQIGTYNAHSADLKNYGGSSLGAASMSGNNKMPQPKQNFHPTVKPTDLMLYLIRLVTPKGGTTLDPFMGSGSTGKAAVRGGFDFVGIEMDEEYMEIATARIQYEQDNPYNEEKRERTEINKNSHKFF